MGQPKTQTVGGGTASPVADQWNSWLSGQMWQTPGAGAVPQTIASANDPNAGARQHFTKLSNDPNVPFAVRDQARKALAGIPAAQNTPAVPGPFQDLVKSMANPDYAKMIAGNPFLSGLQGFNPMAQLPNAPSWVPTQFQTPEKIDPGNIIGDVPTVTGATGDIDAFLSRFGSPTGARDLLSQFGIDPTKFGQPPNLDIPGLTGPAGIGGIRDTTLPEFRTDFTQDPAYQAIQDVSSRQRMKDVADLRARYGMMGNTASSGASLAESQYLAEANPRMAMQLSDLARQIRGQDLQQMGLTSQHLLGQGGLDLGQMGELNRNILGRLGIQSDLTRAGAGFGQQGMSDLLNYIQGTRGQDIGVRGQDIGAAGNIMDRNLINQQQSGMANAANIMQALLADQAARLSAGQINTGNIMDLNRLNLQQGLGQNQFNQGIFGQLSQNVLNNQGMANDWMKALGSFGINLQGLGMGGQQDLMNNFFRSFMQTQGIGTPQAQTVQTPSQASQWLGAASMFLPMFLGLPPVPGLQTGGGNIVNNQAGRNI